VLRHARAQSVEREFATTAVTTGSTTIRSNNKKIKQ
jgi:hypothetical protein